MPARAQRLVLLHTNDIHSHFEQMPRIAALLRELRRKHAGVPTLTIDGGDHMDRVRLETEGTAGEANVEVMNRMGYDIAVPGNNEGITFTPATLREAIEHRAAFTFICSNLHDPATGSTPSWMVPYEIRQCGTLQVGIIGVTAYFPDFYDLIGWDIREPYAVVRAWTERLRPHVDVLLLVSHLGYKHDIRMAEEIAGIDVILGAHTHHLLEEPERVGNTYVCAAGKFGQYVGETIVEYDPAAGVRVSGRCHPVSSAPEEADISRLVARFREEGRRRLAAVVATLEEPIGIEWEDESRFGNLLAAGLRRWTSAEIGLVNAGQLLQSLRPGDVTREQLLALCPSPINPCRMRLRGDRIAQALEESLIDDFRRKPIFGFGFRGKMLGCLCVDGLQVEYDPSAEAYRKIRRILVNDKPFEPERVYTVGTIDMFSFGIGYLSLRESDRFEYFLPEFLRDVLAVQLADRTALLQASEPHWFAVGRHNPIL